MSTAVLLLCAAAPSLHAQDADSVTDATSLRNHLERSYVTIGPLQVGNGPPLLFEGNISPAFLITETKRAALVLTPKVILRMRTGDSWPVRTPSYMPRMSLYFFRGPPTASAARFFFVTSSHHSNGQEGDFYLPNGEINDRDGSFSTNFVEVGFQDIELDEEGVSNVRASLEVHPSFVMEPELRGQYSQVRLHLGSTYTFNDRTATSIELSHLFGDAGPASDSFLKRFQLSVTSSFTCPGLSEVAFFGNVYLGQDYYNMQFERYRSMLRLGIITTFRNRPGPIATTR